MHFNLYPHQKKQNKMLRKALKKDNHIIYQAPTGFGKSVVMADLIQKDINNGLRVLVLAPRRALVFQLEKTFVRIRPHVLMGVINRGDRSSGLILSSIQTTNSKLKQDSIMYNDIDKIYIDEVHIGCDFDNAPAERSQFSLLYAKYWNVAKWVGFSATPITASGYRLGGWDNSISKYQTGDLIKMGYLADFIHKAPVEMDTSKLRVDRATNEYNVSDIEDAVFDATAISSLKKHTLKHYKSDTKCIMFCVSIQHAELVQKEIGVNAFIIHSKLTDAQQRNVLSEFAEVDHGMIINVGILTVGFDDPTVNLLVIARPIRSVRLAIQVYGRGLRKYGDKVCTILDMCSVHKSCGVADDHRDFNKVKPIPKPKEEIEEVTDERICLVCGEGSPSGLWSTKTKIKKKSILKIHTCPECGEDTEKLTLLKKIKKMVVIRSRRKRLDAMMKDAEGVKTLAYKDRKATVVELVTDNTRAKGGMAHYVIINIKRAKLDSAMDYIIHRYDKGHLNSGSAWKELELVWDMAKEQNDES